MKETSAPHKILVIDDEPELRELMKDVLEDEGYQVCCAGSGADGIVLTAQEHPELILLDMRMPEMDGIATLRRIRETDDQVMVIILTGYGCPDTIRDAADLDVSEYLSKPFENEDLVAIIANAFER